MVIAFVSLFLFRAVTKLRQGRSVTRACMYVLPKGALTITYTTLAVARRSDGPKWTLKLH